MSRKVLTTLFAIFASAALVAAQAPPQSTPTPQAPAATPAPQTPAPQSAAKAPSLTIEGCVQRSTPGSTTGAVGTAGSAGSPFILANAAKPKDAPASSVTVASSYRLDAEESKLTPHVNQRVQITGSVEAMAAAAAPGAPPASGAANAPRFKVETVKMIAASCTP